MNIAEANDALIDAIIDNDIEAIESAITVGADVNHDDEIAMFHAVLSGNADIVTVLRKHGGQCKDLGIKALKRGDQDGN